MSIQKRNYGIDFLRILAMWMIPILHVLGHGGILASVKPLSPEYQAAWFLEIAAYCAVNCFALISGYMGVEHRWKWSSIVALHLQVSFYTILFTIIYFITFQKVDIKLLVEALLPVITGQYWYFTAYFGMFFLIPFMNHLLCHLSRRQLRWLMGVIIMVFSVFSIYFGPFKTAGGYSTLWLSLLYLMGGALRLLHAERIASSKAFFLIYALSVLATWCSKYVIEQIAVMIWQEPRYGGLLVSYTSPTIILAGVALLLACSRLQFSKRWETLIGFFSPLAFGVYLIHDNALIRWNFITGHFTHLSSLSAPMLAIAVMGIAAGIWLAGSLIDYIRLRLFQMLNVKQLCRRIDDKLPSFEEELEGVSR